jgi:hypothetical protein
MAPNSFKFDGGSPLMKELQATVALAAFQSLTPETMKEQDVWERMSELYHGNGSKHNISLAEQAVKGCSMFAGLYDKEVQIVTDAVERFHPNKKARFQAKLDRAEHSPSDDPPMDEYNSPRENTVVSRWEM